VKAKAKKGRVRTQLVISLGEDTPRARMIKDTIEQRAALSHITMSEWVMKCIMVGFVTEQSSLFMQAAKGEVSLLRWLKEENQVEPTGATR
jgi:hypothetical protein